MIILTLHSEAGSSTVSAETVLHITLVAATELLADVVQFQSISVHRVILTCCPSTQLTPHTQFTGHVPLNPRMRQPRCYAVDECILTRFQVHIRRWSCYDRGIYKRRKLLALVKSLLV